MTTRTDFEIETAYCNILLDRRAMETVEIVAERGMSICRLDREQYLEEVIKPMILKGEIDDGTRTPFDDRKLRYDKSWLHRRDSSELLVGFGVTHYKAFLDDIKRSDEENLRNQELGKKDFGDRWAYFARAPGVAVLPINRDGTIFIGERANVEYGGFLNAVAGHLSYRDDIAEVDLYADVFRELEEEFGIQRNEVSNIRQVGVYSHPVKGDLDFTFLVDVDKPEEYFASGKWKESVGKREHKDLVRLATMGEIQELLGTGRVPGSDRKLQVMYSTRGALQSVYANEIRN